MGALDIAKEKGLQIGENDTQNLGQPEPAVPVEQHEQTKDDDAGELDDGAILHSITPVVNEVDAVAADGQDNKSVKLPEPVSGGRRRCGYGMVCHAVIGVSWIQS